MSSQVAYHRSPCPGRIFEDLGVGFSIGCAGGSLFYFFKGKFIKQRKRKILIMNLKIGMWNAPRRQRIISGLTHVRNRAPFLGGMNIREYSFIL